MNRIATLLFDTIQRERARRPDRPPLIGVAGAQGSGKTTLCALLEATNRPRFAHVSLDDVYCTKAERADLATRVHPLFATRGPPGTHALGLARDTLKTLREATQDTETPLPRFDKAADDRAPLSRWPIFNGRPEAILFDGWCLGALPDNLSPAPINKLEAEEDADGSWRDEVREHLAKRYQPFFADFDAHIYLQAPSWEIVRQWRGEQERQTLGRPLTPEEGARLDRFVMHYERLTRSMLAGRHTARVIVHLDEAREVVRVEEL
jgi:D-glycerate 3-kinase